MENELLSISEAAAFLRLSPKTLYFYVWQRKIPFIKYAGRLWFEKDRLAKWIYDHRVEPVR